MQEPRLGDPPMVRVRGLRKSFGAFQALDGVDLDILGGEFLTLLGPSGCGKTTLMRLIAGLEVLSEGSIAIKGRDVGSLPPRERGVGMVFQSYALFPHMSVAENVGYGLKVKGLPKREIAARVEEMLDLIRLPDVASRRPTQLSGGQQQRVALARALAIRPSILMLDEPLGALDLKLRRQMQLELRRIHRETGTTVLFVTHDQEEALFLSDRIAVMKQGKIEQLATPLQIYHSPETAYVADFIGDVTLVDCEISGKGGSLARIAAIENSPPFALRAPSNSSRCQVAVRPEHVFIANEGEDGIRFEIDDVINEGSTTLLALRAGSSFELKARVMTRENDAWRRGSDIRVAIRGAAPLPEQRQ